MFRTALIALDHSAAQGPLLDCLTDLRQMGVCRVVLTHVVKLGYGQGAEYGNKEALEHWLRGRAAPLREGGLEVDVDIRAAGEVGQDILAAASEHRADLIVIGSRGQNWVKSMTIGSTAANLCEIARRPVLMVPGQKTGV